MTSIKVMNEVENENITTPSPTVPATASLTIAEKKKRGRKKKYETEEEAHKVAQEQRRNYRERQREKIEQKRLLRSMLDSIPSLKKRLIEANAAIFNLMKGTEPKGTLYELPADIYDDAYSLLHPIKKKMSVKADDGPDPQVENIDQTNPIDDNTAV
jgi:hypothetical protein